MTTKTLSPACYRYDGHKDCRGCVCECHEANPKCWWCDGTGTYVANLEFVVCGCVLERRRGSSEASAAVCGVCCEWVPLPPIGHGPGKCREGRGSTEGGSR